MPSSTLMRTPKMSFPLEKSDLLWCAFDFPMVQLQEDCGPESLRISGEGASCSVQANAGRSGHVHSVRRGSIVGAHTEVEVAAIFASNPSKPHILIRFISWPRVESSVAFSWPSGGSGITAHRAPNPILQRHSATPVQAGCKVPECR